MARDVIPTIIIAQPFTELPLTPLKTIVIVLKFTNPSEEQMEISLFTPFSKNLTEKTEVDTNVTAFNNLDTENQSCEVTLLAKDFTVEKYSEFLEFDQSSLASLNTNDLLTEGVLEKKFNTTSVLVDIKPIKMKMKNKKNTLSTSEAINNIEHEKQVVEFPLLVTFPRKSEENGEVSEESFWVIVSVGYLDNNFIAEATNK
ncbi:hypothetical protein HK099_005219 [Clydaea vesicula]|uniref:Dynactin subunit 4 n=1 Tax=Clydaea vesicula TaxID=447962 RepID=A0AAD5Y464_9FUNG|nr:hypothetical protein HK099_005219 [Clydaea vesicula]